MPAQKTVELNVVAVPVIATPFPNPLRHPVYWWKTRKLRADVRAMVIAEVSKRFNEHLERELVHGRGD